MKKIYSLLLILSVSALLFAVPASPDPVTVTYDDGRTLTYFVKGDENRNWYETLDGYQIRDIGNSRFEYVQNALFKSTNAEAVLAHDPMDRDNKEAAFVSRLSGETILSKVDPESMKMGAPVGSPFDQTDFPTLGTRKFLLILVDFPDKRMVHTKENFDSLMNAKNYTYDNAIGSVNEYYRTTSFGQFDPRFDVAGPFTLDSSYAFYGADDGDDTDVNIQKFVYDAIRAADDSVDFSDYDLDGDGYVDNVYFIYAGYGQASGAPSNTIWPHRWAYWSSTLQVDGKYIWDYSTSMELLGTSGTTRTSIGVICHEFGHVCGLPDFYDTDYSGSGGNSGGLGSWDEMAGGSWNDGGRRPPIFNAWSRMYLKWANPIELTGTQNIQLDSAYTQNESYYYLSPTDGEFFMLENRQRVGFDAAIPGHGMLIYHIDMNSSRWNNNSLNCDPSRQAFDLEEADGFGNLSAGYDNAGDPFPGSTHNTQFLDTGSPNAQDWAGNPSRHPIRNITETNGVITFAFGDPNVDAPANFSAEALGYDSVRVGWTLNNDSDSVMIVWGMAPITGFPQNFSEYDIGDDVAGGEVVYKGIDTTFYHTGLQPGMTHYYAVYSFNDSAYAYSDKISGSAKTASPPFYTTDFSQGIPEGWVAYDRNGNGTFSADNPESRTIASTTASNGFITVDSEHAGDTQIDAELTTQSYNFALAHSVVVKFQHRLEVSSITLARLLYTTNNGLSWFQVAAWTGNTGDPENVELDLSTELTGFRDVKFKFNYKGTNQKYWCIDDFEILAAQDTGLSAGFHTATVSGPKPLTVSFMNTSVSGPDSIDSYVWEFGDDGQFYYDKAPTHTYTMSGTYSVSLTANKDGKVSTFNRDNYIEVINNPPTVINEKDTLDVAMNAPGTVNLNNIFMDPNGDTMTFSWSGNSANLGIALQDDSLLVLTPVTDYLGTETVTLVAKDNENDSTSYTVDIWISETGTTQVVPGEFKLSQNFPNPFNPTTAIRFQLPVRDQINLSIYDLNGHRVRTLISGIQDAGYYTVNFHAGDLPSGVYLYRLSSGTEVVTKKMVLMK
jgi:M6 family metalloprotease-like protein